VVDGQALGPVVVLIGEDGPDQADEGLTVEKMPTAPVRRLIWRPGGEFADVGPERGRNDRPDAARPGCR